MQKMSKCGTFKPRTPIELADSKTCTVKLEQGNIELFGIELGTDTTYTLEGPCSLALFSWYGAQVTVKGDVEMAYLSSYTAIDTPMHQYINTHDGLSYLRSNARESGSDPGRSGLRQWQINPKNIDVVQLTQGHNPVYVNWT